MRMFLVKMVVAAFLVGSVVAVVAAFVSWNRGSVLVVVASAVVGLMCGLIVYAIVNHEFYSRQVNRRPARAQVANVLRESASDEDDWSNPHWQRFGESLLDFKTKVVGVTKKNADGTSRQKILSRCQVGEQLFLIREPENPADENAVKLCREDGSQIGFLSAFRAAQVAPVLDRGFVYAVVIEDLTQGPSSEIGCNISLVTMGRGRVRAVDRGREMAVPR